MTTDGIQALEACVSPSTRKASWKSKGKLLAAANSGRAATVAADKATKINAPLSKRRVNGLDYYGVSFPLPASQRRNIMNSIELTPYTGVDAHHLKEQIADALTSDSSCNYTRVERIRDPHHPAYTSDTPSYRAVLCLPRQQERIGANCMVGMPYGGLLRTEEECEKLKEADRLSWRYVYRLEEPCEGFVIDGLDARNAAGCINDPHFFIKDRDSNVYSVRAKQCRLYSCCAHQLEEWKSRLTRQQPLSIWGIPYVFILTERPISDGEELLLDYGEEYWIELSQAHAKTATELRKEVRRLSNQLEGVDRLLALEEARQVDGSMQTDPSVSHTASQTAHDTQDGFECPCQQPARQHAAVGVNTDGIEWTPVPTQRKRRRDEEDQEEEDSDYLGDGESSEGAPSCAASVTDDSKYQPSRDPAREARAVFRELKREGGAELPAGLTGDCEVMGCVEALVFDDDDDAASDDAADSATEDAADSVMDEEMLLATGVVEEEEVEEPPTSNDQLKPIDPQHRPCSVRVDAGATQMRHHRLDCDTSAAAAAAECVVSAAVEDHRAAKMARSQAILMQHAGAGWE